MRRRDLFTRHTRRTLRGVSDNERNVPFHVTKAGMSSWNDPAVEAIAAAGLPTSVERTECSNDGNAVKHPFFSAFEPAELQRRVTGSAVLSDRRCRACLRASPISGARLGSFGSERARVVRWRRAYLARPNLVTRPLKQIDNPGISSTRQPIMNRFGLRRTVVQ